MLSGLERGGAIELAEAPVWKMTLTPLPGP